MNYPLRFPLSHLFARFGATITVSINFIYDDDENVFIATSNDIEGLVLEAENFNELKKEVAEAIPNLLNLGCKESLPKQHSDIIFKSHLHAT